MSLIDFTRRNARPLLFGALHSFYSAPGQTYVIGLFIATISATLGIGVTEIGALYLAATFFSAATLVLVGHWIDHVRLVHFSAAVVLALALACFVTASASGPTTLLAAFYLLRLTGQGLMVHVEATATARTFEAERGRALGITALGTPLAEMIFPPLAILGIAIVGWQATYAWMGAIALLVVFPLTQWLLRTFRRAPPGMTRPQGEGQRLIAGLRALVTSSYVLMILPALAILPFHITAIMFHVTTISASKGWPASILAVSFPVMAVASVAGLFVSGQIIDRYTARQLFPFVSVPVLIGIALLAMFEALWTMPVALGLVGLGLGLAHPTLTAIWAELFGVSALGAIRSGFAMYTVFMSGLAPFVFGLSLDLGWIVSAILWAMVAYGALALLPVMFAERYDFHREQRG